MNFPQAIASCFRKYATFSGRATRAEYWYWVLFLALGRIARPLAAAVLAPGGAAALWSIFSLAVLLPTIAVAVRRLHDVNRSGWWLLAELTVIGIFYPLLVWKCTKGTSGPNRFGEDSIEGDRIVAQFE
jgi:uncharacterized membrane protein YhaH (DUF805 family)